MANRAKIKLLSLQLKAVIKFFSQKKKKIQDIHYSVMDMCQSCCIFKQCCSLEIFTLWICGTATDFEGHQPHTSVAHFDFIHSGKHEQISIEDHEHLPSQSQQTIRTVCRKLLIMRPPTQVTREHNAHKVTNHLGALFALAGDCFDLCVIRAFIL